jgi:riboflavin synthase
MFTGIIETVGKIGALQKQQGDLRLRVDTENWPLQDVHLGDSIAVNGVCLTVTKLEVTAFWADVSNESLAHTRMADYKVGTPVNLEKAMSLSTRLGGHLVSGHVDGVGTIASISRDARSIKMLIRCPQGLRKYIAEKGSITIDGISLTVNSVNGAEFSLNLIPHTADQTTLQMARIGDKVHIEVDLLARYLERLMTCETEDQASSDASTGITPGLLASRGFMK